MDYFLYLRETFVNNFNVSIKAIKCNNYIIKNSYFLFPFRLFPFFFFKLIMGCFENKYNIQYVYRIDNLYFSNCKNVHTLSPFLLEFNVYVEDDTKINLLNKIKKYNLSVPFWFFIYNEKLERYTYFIIKYMFRGDVITKKQLLEDFDNKILSNIF